VDASQEQSSFMTPAQPEVTAPLKHSGPGIASFILGLLGILLAIVGLVVAVVGIADYLKGNDYILPEPAELAANGLFLAGSLMFVLSFLVSVVGLVLGIVGCVIRNRRRVFAILGVVFNAILSVGTIILYVFGLIARQMA
jgi:hypothetical protein